MAVKVVACLLLASVALSACSSDNTDKGKVGFVQGYLGGVVADEPAAALVGRNILSAGGTAADAAVAVYFALSVTLPSTATLGGGGVCLVHDRNTGKTETLEFLARRPSQVPSTASRPSAVPGNVRGMFALQSKYGTLPWAQDVSPAERLARFGTRVSRAFARDLATVEPALMRETESRRVFSRADGSGLVREGDLLTQLGLAGVLTRLRTLGPGDFYAGHLAQVLVDGVHQAGGTLSLEDLRDYQPHWLGTIAIPYGNETIHFTPPPADAGAVAAELWSMLVRDGRYGDAPAEARYHLFAEAAMRAFADRGQWMKPDGESTLAPAQLINEKRLDALWKGYDPAHHTPAKDLKPAPKRQPENPAATSFVTVDRFGSAVSCTITPNNLFGTGRVAVGTGIVLAALPDGNSGRGPMSLGSMMVINENSNEFHFAAAAQGGVAAPTALISVALRNLVDGQSLEEAVAAKRIHDGGLPDRVYYEEGFSPAALKGLTDRGHEVAATPVIGKVNAISCPGGIPPRPDTCQAQTDPRGFGLAVSSY